MLSAKNPPKKDRQVLQSHWQVWKVLSVENFYFFLYMKSFYRFSRFILDITTWSKEMYRAAVIFKRLNCVVFTNLKVNQFLLLLCLGSEALDHLHFSTIHADWGVHNTSLPEVLSFILLTRG